VGHGGGGGRREPPRCADPGQTARRLRAFTAALGAIGVRLRQRLGAACRRSRSVAVRNLEADSDERGALNISAPRGSCTHQGSAGLTNAHKEADKWQIAGAV